MRPAPRGGADRDDRAAAALLHPGQEALQGQERAQQIAVDRGPPAVLGDVLQRRGRGEAAARVGDQQGDRAPGGLDLAADRLDLAEVGDVTGDGQGLAAVVDEPAPDKEGVCALGSEHDFLTRADELPAVASSSIGVSIR